MNKPLRVCAVVRNEGEPGGAPFWVEDRDGNQTCKLLKTGTWTKAARNKWPYGWPRIISIRWIWSAARKITGGKNSIWIVT